MKPLAIAVLSLASLAAHAASFDCAKAATAVEKLICNTPSLSALDIRLAKAYRAALSASTDPQEMRRAQIAWLARRNACKDVRCIETAYAARLEELTQAKKVPTSLVRTVVGTVRIGSLDSGLELENGDFVAFDSDSEVGTAILRSCTHGDRCRVTGQVDESDPEIAAFTAVADAAKVTTSPARAASSALGFRADELASTLYLAKAAVNAPQPLATLEQILTKLRNHPKLASLTSVTSPDGRKGFRWKLQGRDAGGVFLRFEDGEARVASYLAGDEHYRFKSRQDEVLVTRALLGLLAESN